MNPGRGQKKCFSCNSIIGVRSKKCPNCNFVFDPTAKVIFSNSVATSSSKVFLSLVDEDNTEVVDTDLLGEEEAPRFEVPLTKVWSFGPAGRGQKKCDSCGALNGTRAYDCGNCDHTFEIKKKDQESDFLDESTKNESKKSEKDLGYYIVPGGIPYDPKKEIILSPAGHPPIPLPDGIGDDGYSNIIEWGKKVVDGSSVHYTNKALAYWCDSMPICDPGKNAKDWLFYRQEIVKALATVPGIIVMK